MFWFVISGENLPCAAPSRCGNSDPKLYANSHPFIELIQTLGFVMSMVGHSETNLEHPHVSRELCWLHICIFKPLLLYWKTRRFISLRVSHITQITGQCRWYSTQISRKGSQLTCFQWNCCRYQLPSSRALEHSLMDTCTMFLLAQQDQCVMSKPSCKADSSPSNQQYRDNLFLKCKEYRAIKRDKLTRSMART